MGRPINFKKIGGDTSQPGNQLQYLAWFDGEGSAETAWLRKQTGVSRFILVAEADNDRSQTFYIQEGEPSEAGEAVLKVRPFTTNDPELEVDGLTVSAVEIEEAGADIDEVDGTYTVNIVGGTSDTVGELELTVTSGVVTNVTIVEGGSYTVIPENPVNVDTVDQGSVAPTFNLSFGIGTVTVVNGGEGYQSAPTINVITEDVIDVDPEFTVVLDDDEIDTVTATTAGEGFTQIPQLLASFAEGSFEYVRSIQQHRVKTYEGNIYKYDVDQVAEVDGEVTIKVA